METQFFKENALSDAGKRRLKALAKSGDEIRRALTEWLCSLNTAPRVDSALVRKFVETTGETPETVQDLLGVVWLLASHIGTEKASPDAYASDALEANILDSDESRSFREFLVGLGDAPERIHTLQQRMNAKSSGMPTLSSSSMCVSVKQIVENPFDYDEQTIDTYVPKVLGYQPVAQVELSVRAISDKVQTVAFQLDSDNLDRFISDLVAIQKQLQLAEGVDLNRPTEELTT